MSITLGDAILYLAADDSKLNSALKGAERSTLDQVNALGKKVTLALGAAVVGAGLAVGKFLASTISPASDLNETISKTTVVFGKNAEEILAWGKTAAESLGLSENSALSAAATYGNLFRAMNISEDASANMSRGLVNLAGDLASFNNMDPTEVLDKLRAGLTGETEPLKSLGVNINQALLEQKALEMGLWDGNGALDAAAKAQASYALILEQTTLAQGDFERTSDGLANQQRIMAANWENIKATLGTALLPIVTKVSTAINTLLTSEKAQAFFTKLTDGLGRITDAFTNLFDKIQGWGIEALFTQFEDGSSILGAFFEDLGMGEADADALAGKIIEIANAMRDWIEGTLVPFVQEHWPEIKAALIGIGAALAAAGIVSIVTGIAGAIAALISPVGAIIAVVALLAAAWTGNWGDIQGKTQAAIDFVKGIIDGGTQFINDLVNGRLGMLSVIFTAAWANIQLLFAAFKAAFSGDWTRFGELLRNVWDNAWLVVGLILSTAWGKIKTGVSNGIQAVIDYFKNTDWGQVGRNILEGIAKGITSGLSIIADAAKSAAAAALNAAKGFLGIQSPSTKFAEEVGRPSAEGFGKGFAGQMSKMGTGAGNDALQAFGGVPALAGSGAGSGSMQFTYVDQRFISLSDEFDAERMLAPIFERFLNNRGYQPAGAS